MIKVKIFLEHKDLAKKRWITADEQVNEFIANNNIEVIDVKFQMNSVEIERTALLLIYKEKGE